MKTRYFLFLIIILISEYLSAELPQFSRFDKITQAEGLSNNQIQCIFQEKAGWMWFGTSQGLNRFDGYQFSVFRSDIDKQGTLRGELTRCIYEDNQNNIWVGTENGGLNLFNREKESFTHFLFADNAIDTVFSVECIIADPSGKLWLATSKGIAFLDENNKLQLLDMFHDGNKRKIAASELLFDKKNNLWIGTYKGLFYYDFQTKTSQYVPLPETKNPDDEIQCLTIDSDNILWIGTYNSGPYHMNLNSKVIRKLNTWVNFSRSETVRAIVEDHQGTLWLGTRGGLIAYDKSTEACTVFLREDDESSGGLSLNSVLSLCVDAKGDLWVGTRGGISYRDNDKQAFLHIKASKNDNRFLNDSEAYCFMFNGNDLLIGTESGGINIYDMDNRRFRYVEHQQGLSSNCVKAFLRYENDILVGTFQGGLNILDATTYKVKEVLRYHSDNPRSLSDDRVWCIYEDHKNNIWMGTQKGVDLYNPQTRSFEHQKFFPQKACFWIYEDETGDIWMGGENEILIYNPKSEKIISYPEVTRSIIPAADKKFWLGTRGHGLALYDKEKGPIKYLTQANGLCNNAVQTLLRDGMGYIWISTTNGLSRFDEKTNEFVNFDSEDGLQDNQFNYTAAIVGNDNNLILGGINGINIFNPLNIRKNFFIPPIVFTDLRVFNKKVEIGSIIKKSINEAPDIRLSYKQNVFSIDFAALSYASSRKNEYAYMMEGFDRDWIFSGTINTATYTNLDPGTYTFKVKGSNSNGLWNDKVASIKITIDPPFWKTTWFRLLMFLAIAMILYQIASYYIKKARLNDELLFEKTKAKKLHEIETMKLRFFTNISHEIRTPLTLILGPLNQLLEEEKVDEESKKKLSMIKKNADQLMKLINQILDFRKLEAGKYKITYGKADLVLFISSIVESFQTMASEKQLEMSLSSSEMSYFTWFDSDKVQKILNNLLSNAIKFTDTNGTIKISFEIINKPDSESGHTSFFQIAVSDSGKGIPAKNIGRIFERFEQAANSKNTTGSGIGLSITREFVKLMNGEISVESKEGAGSKFLVELPLLNDDEVKEMESDLDSKTVINNSLPINALTEDIKKNIILVVDDNTDIRDYIASNFEPEAQVIQAANGKEGYEMALKYIPDIIISDLLMPEMAGDVFCKKIKKDERTSHIPFILLTAVTSKDVEKDVLKAGADDYITKPFDIHILKLKVDNLLSLRNTLREKYKNEFILNPSAVNLVSPDEKFLKKAVDTVEKYMGDADLDIEKFASEVGVSRMQLYRKLEALTNMTVKEFIRDIRLKRAAQLLEQNKANVSEIIYQVGFKDLAYFRKCFREQYGMSPSDYAAKFKQ